MRDPGQRRRGPRSPPPGSRPRLRPALRSARPAGPLGHRRRSGRGALLRPHRAVRPGDAGAPRIPSRQPAALALGPRAGPRIRAVGSPGGVRRALSPGRRRGDRRPPEPDPKPCTHDGLDSLVGRIRLSLRARRRPVGRREPLGDALRVGGGPLSARCRPRRRPGAEPAVSSRAGCLAGRWPLSRLRVGRAHLAGRDRPPTAHARDRGLFAPHVDGNVRVRARRLAPIRRSVLAGLRRPGAVCADGGPRHGSQRSARAVPSPVATATARAWTARSASRMPPQPPGS